MTTPVSNRIQSGYSMTTYLTMTPNILQSGAFYTISVSCGKLKGNISISTNTPPLPGSFHAAPDRGIELQTLFTLSAHDWKDVDLPLSYQFAYVSYSSLNTIVSITPQSSTAFMNTTLPGGDASNNHRLTIMAMIYDSYDAMSKMTESVQVTHLMDIQALNTIVSSQLNTSTVITASNVNRIMQVIAAASTSISRVNCSSAQNCISLHRENCSSVAQTCGPCLSGYVGSSGSQNTPCIADNLFIIPPVLVITNSTTIHYCNKDNKDCSQWEYCDYDSHRCQWLSKSCPNDCSGQGNCLFYNTDTGKRITNCNILATNCDTKCECLDGYGGDVCELTTAELKIKQQVTTTVLTNLLSVTQIQNISQSSILNTVGVLRSISQSPSNLNEVSTNLVQDITNNALDASLTIDSIYSSELLEILMVVDVGLTVILNQRLTTDSTQMKSNITRLDLNKDTFGTAAQILAKYCTLQSRDAIPGDSPSLFVYNNFRLSGISFASADDISSTMISLPTTTLERVTGIENTFIQVEETLCPSLRECSLSNSSIKIQAIEWKAALLPQSYVHTTTNQLLANIVNVHFQGVKRVTIAIRNTAYASNISTVYNMTTHCQRGHVVEYNYTCPNSHFHITHRCAGKRERLISYCPPLRHICSMVNMTNGLLLGNMSSCQLTNYTETYTFCTCSIMSNGFPVVPSARRLDINNHQIIQDSGTLSLSSMTMYEVQDIEATFTAASSLTSPKALEQSLIVILMFVVMWASGIFILLGSSWRKWYTVEYQSKQKVHHFDEHCNYTTNKKNGLKIEKVTGYKQVYDQLQSYIQLSFPTSFQQSPFVQRMVKEVWSHHSYVSFVSSLFSTKDIFDKKVYAQGFQILSIQTMLMFVLALLYDLQVPSDDGTCPKYLTEIDCLRRKSYMDDSQNYCAWVAKEGSDDDHILSTSSFICEFANTAITVRATFYIAIIVSCFSALINRPMDYLFDLLQAPMIMEDEDNNHPHKEIIERKDKPSITTTSGLARHSGRRSIDIRDITNTVTSYQRQKRHPLAHVLNYMQVKQSDFREIPEDITSLHEEVQTSLSFLASSMQAMLQKNTSLRMENLQNAELDNQSFKLTQQRNPSISKQNTQVIQLSSLIHPFFLDYKTSSYTLFQKDLLHQFEHLADNMEERNWYMHLWKIADCENVENLKTWTAFAQEIDLIEDKSRLYIQKLKSLSSSYSTVYTKTATEIQIGHELLHLLILDLLGRTTPAALIYHAKMDAEFRHTRVVSKMTKIIALSIIILMNAFFAYYTVLKGYVKGITWQYNYLLACIMQMMFEVLFFETMETFWMDFFIPSFAMKDVQIALKDLLKTVHTLCFIDEEYVAMEASSPNKRHESEHCDNSLSSSQAKEKYFFVTAHHLFVSYKVAKAFPQVIESMLIQSYTSPLPGELMHKWQGLYLRSWKDIFTMWIFQAFYPSSVGSSSSSANTRTVTLFTIITVFLQWFVAFPNELQRMMVRFVLPFVLSGLILVWQMIKTKWIGYLLTVMFMVSGLAVVVYFYNKQPIIKQSISPDLSHISEKCAKKHVEELHVKVNVSRIEDDIEEGNEEDSSEKEKQVADDDMYADISSESSLEEEKKVEVAIEYEQQQQPMDDNCVDDSDSDYDSNDDDIYADISSESSLEEEEKVDVAIEYEQQQQPMDDNSDDSVDDSDSDYDSNEDDFYADINSESAAIEIGYAIHNE